MIKPTKAEVAAAVNGNVRDVIAPELDVLFCGINPGLYSAATGYHFARPGNRFWPTLYRAGFTPNLLSPSEELELISYGYGITNIASRATNGAADVSAEELQIGAEQLVRKVLFFRPRVLAILGISAFRVAFQQPKAILGMQEMKIGATIVWVLPNPSGLNAYFPPVKLVEVFNEFKNEIKLLILKA